MRRLLRDEDGIALVLSLIVMAALAAGLTTVIIAGTSSGSTAVRASADQQAYNYAEAGVNSAMAALHAANVNALDDTVLPPPPPDAGAHRDDYDDGYVLWGGTFDSSTQSWHITSVGYAHNRSSVGMADRSRTLTATTVVQPSLTQPVNNAVWNYIYVDDPTFTTTLGNSVDINIPFYSQGNMRLSNSAQVSGYALQVKGTVDLLNSSHIGEAGAKVHEAHIAGGCRLDLSGPYVKPCSSAQRVYADISDSVTTDFTKPPVDLANWYANAMPGPRHGCTTGSFPGGFDNDLLGNKARAPVDLMPASSYDCRV